MPKELMSQPLTTYLIKGDGLDLLALELESHDAGKPDLRELLQRALANQKTWALVFLWQWDSLNGVVAATPEEAIAMLESRLGFDVERSGFAAYGSG